MPDVDRQARWLLLILPAAAVALFVGWDALWFVCDDAYIAFRYVGSRHEGWGYTWNPPPFPMVEGYTSWLWVVLLDAVWTVTGIQPPGASTVLGLYAALGSVLATAWLAWSAPWSERVAAHRPLLTATALAGTLGNVTFLTWTSSGLETPLFVALVVTWTAIGLVAPRGPRWPWALTAVAALLALCRPDGLLFCGFSVLAIGAQHRPRRLADLVPFTPLLAPVAHVLWRRATYGAWLPNTHLAKDVGWWPEAGVRYLAYFVLDQAWWLWIALGLAWGWTARDRLRGSAWWRDHAVSAVVVAALTAHAAYYIVRIGGDHFGFRVLAHLPPLLWVAGLLGLDALALRGRAVVAAVLLAGAAQASLSWTDDIANRAVTDAEEIKRMTVPLAPIVPLPLRPLAMGHDALEAWLVHRSIAIPRQTHKWFVIHKLRHLPDREAMLERFPATLWGDHPEGRDPYPATAQYSVGAIGWRLQRVAVIDRLGLNDPIVAANPVREGGLRRMAHARRPPKGYEECFRENVYPFRPQRLVRDRRDPLTPEDLRRCLAWGERAER